MATGDRYGHGHVREATRQRGSPSTLGAPRTRGAVGAVGDRQAQGLSQRQAAQRQDVPRRTLQAWRASQDRLDAWPAVVAFCHSVPGLAFWHRLVIALHVVGVEMGACGMRLVCLVLQRTDRHRFVGASSGTQHQGNRHVDEAMVVSRQEASTGRAHEMPPKEMTLTLDATLTGGLCLVGMDPESNDMVLEHTAPARDHDTGDALMAPALAGRHCKERQATSAAAPGRLASVAHHLGAHHSPDLFPVPHELSKAVSAPMAPKQRAAAKALAKAEATRQRGHEPLRNANEEPQQRRPGRPPQGAASLAQVEQDVDTARHAPQRLATPRAPSATPTTLATWSAAYAAPANAWPGTSSSPSTPSAPLPSKQDAVRAAWSASTTRTAWCLQGRRPLRASRDMCDNRCVSWTWRRPRPTPYPRLACHPALSTVWPRRGRCHRGSRFASWPRASAHRGVSPVGPWGSCIGWSQTTAQRQRPGWRRWPNAPVPMEKGATGTSR